MHLLIGPTHTHLLQRHAHNRGIVCEASESMEGSRVRAFQGLQHRLGSGGHRKGVLQHSQWTFVVQGCRTILFHNGLLELSHHGDRVTGGVSGSSRHSVVTSALIPSRQGGRKPTCPYK